jgi:hypothetical protein
MACKFCGEQDNSRLGMRSKIVNGKVKTIELCSSCLGKLLMQNKSKMENNFQVGTDLGETYSKTHDVYTPSWVTTLVNLYNSS